MTEKPIEQELRATIAVYRLEIDYLEDKIQGFNEQIAAIHKDIDADNEIIEACTCTLELLLKHPIKTIPPTTEDTELLDKGDITDDGSDGFTFIEDTELLDKGDITDDGSDGLVFIEEPKEKPQLFELSDFKTKLPEGIVVFKEDYIPIRPGSSTKYQVINTDNGVFIKMLVNNVYFTFSAKTLMRIPMTADRSLFGDDFAQYFVSALLHVRKLLDDDRTVNPDAIFNKQLKTNTRPEKRTLDGVEI